jgi:hypothetical protein
MNCGEVLKKKGKSANYATGNLEVRQMQATLDLQSGTYHNKIRQDMSKMWQTKQSNDQWQNWQPWKDSSNRDYAKALLYASTRASGRST